MRTPPGQRSPYDYGAPASSRKRVAAPASAATSAHQRHGDRGSSDDDSADRGLPVYVRFVDLKRANIVRNWPQLLRLIASEDFPPGVQLSANTRAWCLDEVT